MAEKYSEVSVTPPKSDIQGKSGYLLKKSTGGDWQKRYFEINGHYLVYYKTHKMTKLLAAVAVPQVYYSYCVNFPELFFFYEFTFLGWKHSFGW